MKDVNCFFIMVKFFSGDQQQNYYTLQNQPVIFQSKRALEFNLAQCVSNTDAQVPWVRQINYSLIIPSSEILVNYYFLSYSVKILTSIDIIMHYNEMLLHLGGILQPSIIFSSRPVTVNETSICVENLRKQSTKEFMRVLRNLSQERPWLQKSLHCIRAWFLGPSAHFRKASCGTGRCHQAIPKDPSSAVGHRMGAPSSPNSCALQAIRAFAPILMSGKALRLVVMEGG